MLVVRVYEKAEALLLCVCVCVQWVNIERV